MHGTRESQFFFRETPSPMGKCFSVISTNIFAHSQNCLTLDTAVCQIYTVFFAMVDIDGEDWVCFCCK